MKSLTIRDYSHIALVAALYIVLTVTPPLNAISYGAYQFRVSEMLNFLAFFHPKYIIAVTLGVMIANFYSFGLIDVFVGGLSTLVFLSLGVYFFKHYQQEKVVKGIFNKAFLYFSFFFAASMVTIAVELVFVAQLPFLWTWFTLAVGELGSLLLGSLMIDYLAKRIDLTK